MQPLKRHAVVDFALREFGELPKAGNARTPIPTVTDQIGFSTRHFNQLFRDQVGLTQNCFVAFDACSKSLICWLAKRRWIGRYCFLLRLLDQAHLIHDFRAFADCTPTEYLAQRGFHPCMWCCPIEVNFYNSSELMLRHNKKPNSLRSSCFEENICRLLLQRFHSMSMMSQQRLHSSSNTSASAKKCQPTARIALQAGRWVQLDLPPNWTSNLKPAHMRGHRADGLLIALW